MFLVLKTVNFEHFSKTTFLLDQGFKGTVVNRGD